MHFQVQLSLLLLLSVTRGYGSQESSDDDTVRDLEFPPDFVFSTATASYQIEGAWNESGKGESIWDYLTHNRPDLIEDGSTGDVACDSYHKFKEDIQLAKQLGTKMYRFSLSWPRILPTGAIDFVNPDGIRYYNAVLDELIANGIEPMVTIYHWDLPQSLQDLGGWPNILIADYFEDFADLVFASFGDRVKYWLTINEPITLCGEGYGLGGRAPAIQSDGRADYQCGRTLLLAHARAYHLYKRKYAAKYGGKIGFVLECQFYEPKDSTNAEDIAAAERALQFTIGWFAHPIYSTAGDFPPVMRERVDLQSEREGLKRSRLPTLTAAEIDLVRGSADFLGVNHYTTHLAAPMPTASAQSRSKTRDANYTSSYDPSWDVSPVAKWQSIVPRGFREAIAWVRDQYGDFPIFITENGFADGGDLRDTARIDYLRSYLRELLKAIHIDKAPVKGYTAWSLLDNFEWFYGYRHHFGLHFVDFNDPNRPRTAKMSSKFIAEVISTRKVPDSYPEYSVPGKASITCGVVSTVAYLWLLLLII